MLTGVKNWVFFFFQIANLIFSRYVFDIKS